MEMHGKQRSRLAATVALGYLVFAATWIPINRFSIGRHAHELWLPGERAIPFVPAFEYLYVLPYLLPLLIVWAEPSSAVMARAVRAFAISLAAAYATYLLFPVYLQRPALEVRSPATWLLALEYRDPSYNHFPSLHVALGWLVYLTVRERLLRRWPLALLMGGVCVATLLVKQHYVVDVVAGSILAVLTWRVAGALTLPAEGPRLSAASADATSAKERR